jgi:hypothetical protein
MPQPFLAVSFDGKLVALIMVGFGYAAPPIIQTLWQVFPLLGNVTLTLIDASQLEPAIAWQLPSSDALHSPFLVEGEDGSINGGFPQSLELNCDGGK